MKVVLTLCAEFDIDDAAAFYEEQEPGLGAEVVDFLYTQVSELTRHAGIHQKGRCYYQMVVGGRFPYYVIYYRLAGDTAVVEAVLDHRRDPQWIRRTLLERR